MENKNIKTAEQLQHFIQDKCDMNVYDYKYANGHIDYETACTDMIEEMANDIRGIEERIKCPVIPEGFNKRTFKMEKMRYYKLIYALIKSINIVKEIATKNNIKIHIDLIFENAILRHTR